MRILVVGGGGREHTIIKKITEIESEKSNTKKLLENYIKDSSNNKYSLNDIFVEHTVEVNDK